MQILLPAILPLLLLHVGEGGIQYVRMNATFKVEPQYHPLYRTGCGQSGYRFRGQIRNGQIQSAVCVEDQPGRKSIGGWFIPNVIQKALIKGFSDSDALEFEVRICNLSPSADFPLGYSFWRKP